MIKKIILGTFITFTSIFTQGSTVPFSFTYQVIANSNNAKDLLHLYEVKENFLIHYDNLIIHLEDKEIPNVVIDNLDGLSDFEDAKVELTNGKIEITIGEGEGIEINGQLKTSYCDNRTINGKLFILDKIID